MEVVSHSLSAGKRTRIHHPGRFFILIATASALDVTFERNGSPIGETGNNVEAGYKRFPGDWSDPDDGAFDTVVLTSASAQTATIGISQSAADYSRTASLVDVSKASALGGDVDQSITTTAAVVSSFSATKRTALLRNIGNNNIRIGNSAVTASRGHQLRPGDAVSVATTKDIYARTETGTSTLSILDTSD